MPSIAETALSAGNRIGRYFSLTSVLPTLVLVLWVYLLAKSGAWSGEPNVRDAFTAIHGWSLADVAWALVVTIVVAFFIHPLQFPTTQLLEGYWRATGLIGRLQAARVQHYRTRRHQLNSRLRDHDNALHDEGVEILRRRHVAYPKQFPDPGKLTRGERTAEVHELLNLELGDPLVPHVLGKEEVDRLFQRFPVDPERTMPTRLGNVLRRYEDRAGGQYGLSAISVVPHLMLVAPQNHVDYVDDARQEMDTSIRLCVISLIATVVSVFFLVTDGWWLLLALVPYALAYLAYRGSVASAVDYGVAFSTIVDLDRFLLYESLRLPPPRSLAAERLQNGKLSNLLDFKPDVVLKYRSSPAGDRDRT